MQADVLEYLENSEKKYSAKTAYADSDMELSYGELLKISQAVGSGLSFKIDRIKNKYPRPVIIFMEKSPLTLAAFFGVLYSGNFYVPVDVEMPVQRIKLIMDNLQPAGFIYDAAHKDEAEEIIPEGIEPFVFEELMKCGIEDSRLAAIRHEVLDTDPVYVLYTSGSTGVPKGVVVSHRSLIDYADHFSAETGFLDTDVVGNQVPFHFDASLVDIYCTLHMGCTMVIIPVQLFSQPVRLLEFMQEWKISLIRWVPSALNMVAAFKALKVLRPSDLREIIFGAETMPTKCFNYWKSFYPDITFIQNYGPTEITGVCTYYKVDRDFADSETIPIGKHFENCAVFLLNDRDELIDEGMPGVLGEICVRGTCLSHGYYNAPGITEKVFTQNPLNKAYPEKIYRTGDLASYNERGELVFASRKDFQIKHMGHRIELGEIEASANTMDGMVSAICIFDSVKSRIIMVYVSDALEEVEILEYLKERLPRYMIPNIMHKIEKMPLTSGGKTDRMKLKAMFTEEKK